MLIIDGHVHIGKWEHERFRRVSVTLQDAKKELKRWGISGACVTGTGASSNAALLYAVQKEKKFSFYFFAWLTENEQNLYTLVMKNLACISGFKIHPSLERKRITHKFFQPYLEIASECRMPVNVHCGRWQKMASYEYALEAAENYTGAPFILEHQGGDTPELSEACANEIAARKLNNVYLGISGVREYWTIQQGIKKLGAARYIFGSDYPLAHPSMYLALMKILKISDKEKQMILAKNILRLLNLRECGSENEN